MATSQRKLNANLENAQHSTGPRTKSGKERSSANAIQHGLTAKQPSKNGERKSKVIRLYKQICDSMEAVGKMERLLCKEIAQCWYRSADGQRMFDLECERGVELSAALLTALAKKSKAIRPLLEASQATPNGLPWDCSEMKLRLSIDQQTHQGEQRHRDDGKTATGTKRTSRQINPDMASNAHSTDSNYENTRESETSGQSGGRKDEIELHLKNRLELFRRYTASSRGDLYRALVQLQRLQQLRKGPANKS